MVYEPRSSPSEDATGDAVGVPLGEDAAVAGALAVMVTVLVITFGGGLDAVPVARPAKNPAPVSATMRVPMDAIQAGPSSAKRSPALLPWLLR
jgi:hypothetical protein